MSWRPTSSTCLKPAVVMSAVGGVLPSRIALVAVVVPWKTRSTSAVSRPARARTLRIAVTNPVSSAPGVEGVFATHVVPLAASAKVMSVKVPPTSTARVPAAGGVTRGIVGPTPSTRKPARRRSDPSARDAVGDGLRRGIVQRGHALADLGDQPAHHGLAPEPRVQLGLADTVALGHARLVVERLEVV